MEDVLEVPATANADGGVWGGGELLPREWTAGAVVTLPPILNLQ